MFENTQISGARSWRNDQVMKSIRSRFELGDRTAIITGASKGIGKSIARGLAEFGATVVVSSRKQEAVDAVAEELNSDGLRAKGIACHVGDADQRSKLVEKVIKEFGKVDILVNNAAVNPYFGPISEIEFSAYQKTLDVNLSACLAMSNLVFPHMKASGGGSIIHITSIEGFHPGHGMGVYSVSKAALNMLTQTQAKEWGKFGIRVNAIAPGLIKTKFSAALWQNEKLMHQINNAVPAGRAGTPEEMAGLAVFLASEAASYCTGSVFVADGGFLLSGGL